MMDDMPLSLGSPHQTEDEYPVHPAAEAFRMLADDELQALADDIAEKGLFDPIMLDRAGEMLVDGRNRLKACRLAGVEPRFERLPVGIDPVGYIVSKNINRRDLTKGQKAIALALIYPEGARGRGNIDPARKSAESASFSFRRLGVARQIARHPDLADAVRLGAMPFETALAQATERQQAAMSQEAHLARLQAEAPDVAALVVEGTLTLAAALAELDERERKKRVAIESGRRSAIDLVPQFSSHVAAIVGAIDRGETIQLSKEQKGQLQDANALLRKWGVI
jgi:hypothetical protein